MSDTHVMEYLGDVRGSTWLRCPKCGRELFLSWPPSYSKVVAVEGDNLATHAAGIGGLVMGEATIIQKEG